MKMNLLILSIVMLFSCSSEKNLPISIDNAECLFLYKYLASNTVGGVPDREGNVVNSKDCNEKWTWEQKERWNICKEQRFAYRIEFNEENLYVINMFYSSTGTGEFTNLVSLEIKDGVFTLIESIAGGDRCQHGLISEEIEYKDNHIFYSELITPFHLMSWNGRKMPFGSYDDCMICCCGAAKYKYNPISKEKEFLGIELLLDEIEGDDNFSKTYNLFLQKGKKILQEKDIIEFIKSVDNE